MNANRFALFRPPAVVEVRELPAGAAVPYSLVADCNRAILAEREPSSEDGASLILVSSGVSGLPQLQTYLRGSIKLKLIVVCDITGTLQVVG